MKTTISYTIAALLLGAISSHAEVDCPRVSVEVANSVKGSPDKILEIVSAQLSASPSCACEIVKAAIESSSADAQLVAAIVETAAGIVPEQMRLVAQCAVAVAPDALADVQAVLAKFDPNTGESSSAKSAKSGKDAKAPVQEEVASIGNPLDFPGDGPVGPLPIFPGPPGFFVPIDPDAVSPTDSGSH